MPVPRAVLYARDLKSAKRSLTGSKRTAPSGAEAQTLPLPSTSTVTAPPSGDMLGGVMYTSILSVLGSSLPRLRRPGLTSNQKLPSWSRTRPCALAASPSLRFTLRNFTAPVLASTRPTVTRRLGLFEVNQRLPSKSMPPSWVMRPSLDVVPIDQSVPSLG